jgi:hypothetical protein
MGFCIPSFYSRVSIVSRRFTAPKLRRSFVTSESEVHPTHDTSQQPKKPILKPPEQPGTSILKIHIQSVKTIVVEMAASTAPGYDILNSGITI